MEIMLSPEVANVFRTTMKASFDRYSMEHADLVDHACSGSPSAKELSELEEYASSRRPCACVGLPLGKPTERRQKMREVVQNALNEARPLAHARAWALFSLVLSADKVRKYHATHPEERRPDYNLIHLHEQPGFLIPPWPTLGQPRAFPALGLTPHGVTAIAEMLTKKLAAAKTLKVAQDDVRALIVETLREMHGDCNRAFILRLMTGTSIFRIDVTDELVRVKYDSVRSTMGIDTRTETHIAIRNAWKTERPENAHDPDHFQFVEAMLWNDWQRCGNVVR